MVKTDWTHCAVGGVLGLIVALVNIVTMEVLFEVPCQEVVHVVDEYVLKVVRCATNSCAILATLIGVVQVQKFVDKISPEESSMDVFLLNVGGTSSFVYMFFTIVVGVFTNDDKDVPGSLHIVNGILDVGQITFLFR